MEVKKENVWHFDKMQGAGNDFVFVDLYTNNSIIINDFNKLGKDICDRRFGVGADGWVFVMKPTLPNADIQMKIINSDGSNAEMCGNASRCFGKYVYEKKLINKLNIVMECFKKLYYITLDVNADSTLVNKITVNMGTPSFEIKDIPLNEKIVNDKEKVIQKEFVIDNKKYKWTCLLVGVPHTVIFVDDYNFSIEEIGKKIEHFELFPKLTNVNFVHWLNKKSNEIEVKTWERGAGLTLACGTGSCSSAFVSAILNYVDKTKDILVHLPGGNLSIFINAKNEMFMKGGAEFTFKGEIKINN